ncbi:alpha-ribazole phosphatase [Sulfuriferula thiophila]|uniref:alpha-ribazole phosphatase n=1 Tax=Sulfuriferula thiophila TaxID=1781211 RepID=UPI000F60B9EA|nr:alpha-ribazole phosphatase [Sulfuriferula thiophila]
MTTELILVRHTRVAVAGMCYGRMDVPLADSFDAEVSQVKAQLADAGEAVYFTSPAQRCLALAQHLAPNAKMDARVAEMDFGAWEGMAWDAIGEPAISAWANDFVNLQPPQGESYLQMAQRVSAFLEDMAQHERVVVVTHAGVIRAAHALLNAIPLADSFAFQPEFGGVYRHKLGWSQVDLN